MNFTLPVNVTQAVEVLAEIADDATGTPNVLNIVKNIKEDIRTITNLTRLIEQTPIKDFNEKLIAWDAIERLLEAFGLNTIIDVEVVKAFIQTIEDTLEDPDQLIEDFIGFSLTESVE